MKLLVVGDDFDLAESEIEVIFKASIYPYMGQIKKMAITKPDKIERYAIKWAKKFHVTMEGFSNDEAASDYADVVLYVGRCGGVQPRVVSLCEEKKKDLKVFKIFDEKAA